MQFHFIWAKVTYKKIQLKFYSIENMVVENWTKSLLRGKHEYCIRKVGVLSSHKMTKNQKLSQLNGMLNNKLV